MLGEIKKIWFHINVSRKRELMILLFLMIISSFSEMLSIGAVIPFLGALADPERLFASNGLKFIIKIFKINSPQELVQVTAYIFFVAIIFSTAMRLVMLRSSTNLTFSIGADLGVAIYKKVVFQPYSYHLNTNSSEILNLFLVKTNGVIYGFVLPILNLISALVIISTLISALLFLNFSVSVSVFFGLALLYFLVARFGKSKLNNISRVVSLESTRIVKYLQESMGGIREILLDGTQRVYCQLFSQADSLLREAQAQSAYMNASPRYIIEAVGMLCISAAAFMLVRTEGGIAVALPVLGALALGAQRLLPMMQQIYGSWASIESGRHSLRDVLKVLSLEVPSYAREIEGNIDTPISFKETIALIDVSFRYGCDSPYIFSGINLSFKKGSRVGIIGKSGEGKSTFVDLLMGLSPPSEGRIEIDNLELKTSGVRSWQMKIAHVPQSIFLADISIASNIAFGVPDSLVDYDRLKKAALNANIADLIEGWPEKYGTLVGERGVRLSGGQRQRIGIARALYKQAEVLILDEATSALDIETESMILDSIKGLDQDLTLFIVSHRVETLEMCDYILTVEDGLVGLSDLTNLRSYSASSSL